MTHGLLATAFTMEKEFYRDALAARGLRVLLPRCGGVSGDVRGVVLGKLEESSRQTHRRVTADFVACGAERIILGSAEIGLVGRAAGLAGA